MPRKTRPQRGGTTAESLRFNEAAARCRGKRRRAARIDGGLPGASMRPRPDAAENRLRVVCCRPRHEGFNEAAARCRGKRRQEGRCSDGFESFNEAAARCRGKLVEARKSAQTIKASMRPRPDAAENARARDLQAVRPHPASMRPRPDAAENDFAQSRNSDSSSRFNEAAARCRGKRRNAGHPPGRGCASMRPRPDAAENSGCARPASGRAPRASMRPRPDAAENAL